MLKELYTAALGMLPQQTRLEMTANNLANANTVGFKRSGIFEQSLIEARENMLNIHGDAETADVPISQHIDYRTMHSKNLSCCNALLQRIGFAFSATLWGLVTANFLWLPLAQRLQVALDDQRALDRLHIQAARYAAEGITPLLMRYRLAMLLPEERRNQLLRQ
ncbi:MAG: hypothetical protein KatS3mg040_1220 [Candidatus Kapaibacterium sp.]|nr:MAG: hypothetical protein KatS3mg040_1220 [Candidatus Kapabacteria bacterium]